MFLALGIFSSSTCLKSDSEPGVQDPPATEPSTPTHHDPLVGNLVLNADHTKTTTGSGNWSSTATWHPAGVPGAADRVVVSAGHTVTYDVVSDAALGWVRVDGELTFRTGGSSRLKLDTLVVSQSGKLTIGVNAARIPAAHLAEIIIADSGNFDLSYDPHKFSRGIIVEGEVEIYGASKKAFRRVAVDPMIGHTSVVLDAAATNWQVGDRIIVGATLYEGYHWDNAINAVRWFENEDEIRTITSITTTNVADDTVHFSTGLAHDHAGPVTRPDLKTHVGNYSRNVRFSTENAASVPIHHRGHFMVAGNMASADVRYLEADELGRTAKSRSSSDAADVTGMSQTTSVKGRYAMHCHHMGVGDAQRRDPPIFVGNVIFGSPGWGLVQHLSCGNWYNNVSYGVYGAAFVSEAGTENGSWRQNLAIFCRGKSWGTPKNTDAWQVGDSGQAGDGFHMIGRMIRCQGNVAISCNQGFTFFHRANLEGDQVNSEQFQLPGVLKLENAIHKDHPSIHQFGENEVIASNRSLYVEKSNPNQEHDYYTFMEGHLAWNVITGVYLAYTSKYVMENFDLVALDTSGIPQFSQGSGVLIKNNAFEMVFTDTRFEGFQVAFDTEHTIVDPGDLVPSSQTFALVRPTYINNDANWPLFDNVTFGDLFFPNTASLPAAPFDFDTTNYEDATTSTSGQLSFTVTGIKTDGLGDVQPQQLNGLHQDMTWRGRDIVRYLEAKGYYTEAGTSNRYVVIPMWFTDRLDGKHHCYGMRVRLNSGRSVSGFTNHGNINNPNAAPVVADITGQVASVNVTKTFDLIALSGASDSNGETPTLLAVDRTMNADVHNNGDGTVDYISDVAFSGPDSFEFWVQDGHGGITKASCEIVVGA